MTVASLPNSVDGPFHAHYFLEAEQNYPGEIMNRKNDKLAIAVAGALAVVSTGFSAGALAQSTDQGKPAAKERIEVTGSSIKRVEGESALPVTVISREEIDKSGATTPMELLQLISANNS
ncbi:MAG TPA: hypothetical protein VMG61_10300, partial [Usitatibacter sp.]|nr:hypothetical protein [Usitatibacter sp.]